MMRVVPEGNEPASAQFPEFVDRLLPVHGIVRIAGRRSDRGTVGGARIIGAVRVAIDAGNIEPVHEARRFDLHGQFEIPHGFAP